VERNFRMMNDRMGTFENKLQGLEQNFQNMQSRMDALENRLHAENGHLLNNQAAALESRLTMSETLSRILGTLHSQIAVVHSCKIQNLEQSLQRLVLDQNHIQEQRETLHDRMYDLNLKMQRLENLLLIQVLSLTFFDLYT
jgi:chromosome segregation ATPase